MFLADSAARGHLPVSADGLLPTLNPEEYLQRGLWRIFILGSLPPPGAPDGSSWPLAKPRYAQRKGLLVTSQAAHQGVVPTRQPCQTLLPRQGPFHFHRRLPQRRALALGWFLWTNIC